MDKYLSHPNKSLLEHLRNVGLNVRELILSKKLDIKEFIDNNILADSAYIVGVCHDFGKLTSFFQNYILEKDEQIKQKLKNKSETHHSLISALFTYYVIQDYLNQKDLLKKKYYEYLPVICFQIVRRHHGDLNDAIDDAIINNDNLSIIEKQLTSISIEDANKIYRELFSLINHSIDLKLLKEFLISLKSKTFPGKRKLRNIDNENTLLFYFITLLLYSILLDSDKTDAAQIAKSSRNELSSDSVDNFIKDNFSQKQNEISNIRQDIYYEVVSRTSELDLEKDKILSLNLPTGSGKTLTSFSFALKLRQRIIEQKNYIPKIIYSLPFLSIIDQNYSVINEVLDNPSTDVLLKHHHLSDVVYSMTENQYENTNNDVGKNLLQIEGWNSEIIFTTFYQFFHSIVANKNRAIRKFHNISNSIVLFDEVQAIPHKYWLLLKEIVVFFAKYFNTYFVFMTATQPLVIDSIKPLVYNKEKYFTALNRFDLHINFDEIEINDFIKLLKDDINNNPDKDFLIVLNTIKSSQRVYANLKELFEENSKLYYLSTNIIPKLRMCLIRRIRNDTPKRKIIVSTQVVEAGVDLDVDIVYRDFAPFDSINQVAGRCNRNFNMNKTRGQVKIFNIFSQENESRYFPQSIYDKYLLSKTRDVFTNESTTIEEKDLLPFTYSYFRKVKEGLSNNESRKILEYVTTLRYSELSKFKLIEQDYPTVDIFVAISEYAQKVLSTYQQIKSDKDLTGLEKRNEFLKIRKQFNDYIISVPQSYADGFTEGELGYVSKEELSIYYDLETGFKRDNAGKGILNL